MRQPGKQSKGGQISLSAQWEMNHPLAPHGKGPAWWKKTQEMNVSSSEITTRGAGLEDTLQHVNLHSNIPRLQECW